MSLGRSTFSLYRHHCDITGHMTSQVSWHDILTSLSDSAMFRTDSTSSELNTSYGAELTPGSVSSGVYRCVQHTQIWTEPSRSDTRQLLTLWAKGPATNLPTILSVLSNALTSAQSVCSPSRFHDLQHLSVCPTEPPRPEDNVSDLLMYII